MLKTKCDLNFILTYLPDRIILNLTHILTHFDTTETDNFENIVTKGEIAHYEQIFLLTQCFHLYSIIIYFHLQ